MTITPCPSAWCSGTVPPGRKQCGVCDAADARQAAITALPECVHCGAHVTALVTEDGPLLVDAAVDDTDRPDCCGQSTDGQHHTTQAVAV